MGGGAGPAGADPGRGPGGVRRRAFGLGPGLVLGPRVPFFRGPGNHHGLHPGRGCRELLLLGPGRGSPVGGGGGGPGAFRVRGPGRGPHPGGGGESRASRSWRRVTTPRATSTSPRRILMSWACQKVRNRRRACGRGESPTGP